MSIRLRTTLIIAAAAVLCLAVLFLLSRTLILPEFAEIERAEVIDYTRQVISEFDEKFEQVASALRGDACWDDTQAYLRGEYPEYPQENTTPDYIAALNLNFRAFANQDGAFLSSIMVDIEDELEIAMPPSLLRAVAPLADVSLYPNVESAQAGILDVDGQLMVVAALPALSDDCEGLPAGTVIGGFILDETQRAELIDSGLIELQLFPLSQPLPDAVVRDYPEQRHAQIHVQPLSDEVVAGYAVVRSPFGEPTALLRVTSGRDRLQNAMATLSMFAASVIVMGVFVAILVLKLLDQTLVGRIHALEHWIDQHSAITPTPERAPVSGNDEISSLARSFNRLLDNVSRSQAEMERARDEAFAALKFKQQLLANISHDARTPLSVIMLRTENVARGMYGAVSERQREVLHGVRASANQMLFFINNLLAGAKLQSGGLTMRLSPITVGDFAHDIRVMMEPLATEQGLHFDVDVHPLLPQVLLGDSDRLKQIVFNLVDNAIKFTPEGGIISVMLSHDDGAMWQIRVSDNGQGIPGDQIARIFEEFYQVDGSSTRKASSGVGLGLSIVNQLVELMHGRIDVKSVEGVGTTFSIVLPLLLPDMVTA